jgi:predicted transposase/invertase (TIGR01784 family)
MEQTQPTPIGVNGTHKPYAKITLDWTFKRVFGNEGHDKLLLFLLNGYLKGVHTCDIVKVTLRPTVVPAEINDGRSVIFDIACEDERGSRFVVEMQVGKQIYFIKRTLFYASRTISGMVKAGDTWDFNYPRLYLLSFVNFELDFGEGCDEVTQILSVVNRNHPTVFYDNLFHLVFVRLPKFTKELPDCKTNEDKMLYLIQNAHKFEVPPEELSSGIFGEVLELAKISKFTQDELEQYEARMRTELDRYAELNTARIEGEAEGRASGLVEGESIGSLRQAQKMAKWMLAKGMSIADIEDATGLSDPEILALE